MAKVYKIVDPDEPQTSGQCLTTNCVLCQEETVELLKCPANSARGTEGAGYKTLAENLEAFDRISCLPGTLKLSRLDEGQGIEATFRLHKAKWHDSCRLQFNKTKLHRAEKRKMPDKHDPEPKPRKFTRLSREHEQACRELLKCGCKKGCSKGRCKCAKASLQCTALCHCGGSCSQN